MEIAEARAFENSTVRLRWTDRKGETLQENLQVFSVEFLPLYGPCLFTSNGEIKLDRVIDCQLLVAKIAA
jgi:hypothetical protein